MKFEKRAFLQPPELRAGNGAMVARGYAALFNNETDIAGQFRESISPGAFTRTLDGGDIRALIDHDSGRVVIGRTKSGTLRLSEDDRGLLAEIDLPETTDGRDLAVQLERGDISGMSFGFAVTVDVWDMTEDVPVRTIHGVDLFEVSAVAFPAYADTEIALRALDRARDEKEREEAQKKVSAYFRRQAETEQRIRKIN